MEKYNDYSSELPLIRVPSEKSLGGLSYPDSGSDRSDRSYSRSPRKREVLAWAILAVQSCILAAVLLTYSSNSSANTAGYTFVNTPENSSNMGTPLSINNKPTQYHQRAMLAATSNPKSSNPFYDPPTVYPPSAGLVSRVWHSNGSPDINSDLQKGSCWCSGDDFCMCTPSLAIDVVLTSGPDHVWLVRRSDCGKMALMGGFVEVGETTEQAARRELQEELNISLDQQPISLFGVYSDPKRDRRKHAISVVYTLDIPSNVVPYAGDDAKEVLRVPLATIDSLDMFIDHKTVLHDYMRSRETNKEKQRDVEPFKRSICSGV